LKRSAVSALALTIFLVVAVRSAAAPMSVSAEARSLQPGELVVLTIALESTEAASMRVLTLGKTIPAFKLDDRLWRALVGIDIDQKPGSFPAIVEARTATGTSRVTYQLEITPKKFPTRVLRVDPNFVNPPPSVMPRIERDSQFIRDVYSHSSPARLWADSFVRPVPGEANSGFGTRSVYNGEPRSPHSGADFLSGAGTPIRAPNAGRIVAARDLYFTGNTLIIDHGLGLFSMLAHLSRLDVREEEVVTAGQIVGAVGATGRVTGPHLHWALRASGARIDPVSLLELLGEPDERGGTRK
jgi:murein DD-endopeptidase MepM/ murein hydrolase activator NlpD